MSIAYGQDYADTGQWAEPDGPVHTGIEPDNDEPISVVPFPTLRRSALQGTAGQIVDAVMPYTEAHPAAVLVQLLARFGATIDKGPHLLADNREHPARLYPLIVGHTSVGAKGTSLGVVSALFSRAEEVAGAHMALRRISGLSSGEGLIEVVRDERDADAKGKGFDPGEFDKRLFVEDPEFTSTLAVMDRQGSTLPRVIREAWDGDTLRTTTRSPLIATGAHIVITAHVTPGELRIKMSEAQLFGGTMNRFLPIASRRTKLCPDGGNIPESVLRDNGKLLAERYDHCRRLGRVERSESARDLWHHQYGELRKERPDGPVAKILARAVPQVLRLSLAYALIDGHDEIGVEHLRAALALWQYVTDTAHWMFGGELDTGEIDALVAFIAAGGTAGRTRSQICDVHFSKNKKAGEVDALLKPLLNDGQVRQEVIKPARGRPTTRFYAC